MKKFNINDYMYIQISEAGWKHLRETVEEDYIRHCIYPYKVEIDGGDWYKLQCHQVFSLLPIVSIGKPLFNTNVMFDNLDLKDDQT